MSGVKGAGLTKQERVYRFLHERILSGAYGPGFRIVITHVARELSVSALPVREAIRRLEAEGLITFKPNEGAQVAPRRPDSFEHDLAVLAVLDGYGTALASPRVSTARLLQLATINDEMTAAMQRLDAWTFGRLDQDFHGVIYGCCPNPSLTGLLRDVTQRLHAIRRTVFVEAPYRGEASVVEHKSLLSLITERAPAEEVERAARGHKLGELESFREWHEKNR